MRNMFLRGNPCRSRYEFQNTKVETEEHTSLSPESVPAISNGSTIWWDCRSLKGIRRKECLNKERKICVQCLNYYVDVTSRNQYNCKPREARDEEQGMVNVHLTFT